jgi:hypothetical protein
MGAFAEKIIQDGRQTVYPTILKIANLSSEYPKTEAILASKSIK